MYMKKKEFWPAKIWRVIKREKVRLWLFRVFGMVGTVFEVFATWFITAFILNLAALLMNQFGWLNRLNVNLQDLMIGFSAAIVLIVAVYFCMQNMRWARKISEMDETDFDDKALGVGVSVLGTMIIIIFGAGIYQLYKWIF